MKFLSHSSFPNGLRRSTLCDRLPRFRHRHPAIPTLEGDGADARSHFEVELRDARADVVCGELDFDGRPAVLPLGMMLGRSAAKVEVSPTDVH